MAPIEDINVREIYPDLLRHFVKEGHKVYIVSPRDRRLGINTYVKEEEAVNYMGVKTLNLQKTNVIEKGIGQVLVSTQFKSAIRKYWRNVKFDLILYATPPITLQGVVQWLKKKNPQAMSYLMLKDIFPQNAIDIGMMTTGGVKGLLYRHFRKQEKKLYKVSDFIGCMSPANVSYVLKNNPEIPDEKVEVAPNSVDLKERKLEDGQLKAERLFMRKKYNIPTDKPVFIYGGNLGKPQGIHYLIECLEANKHRSDCFFLIVGNGTEYGKLESWYRENQHLNVKLMAGLPKSEYHELVRTCDVGLIFLDHRFSIPNYPSRVLSYMEYKMPVLCATDLNSDMGRIAEENGYGYWCESNSVEAFTVILDKMIHADRKLMGEKGYQFMKENYTVENTYGAIIKHFEGRKA
jgi:glycosyltransferase involved in cell wall biosynthesis